MPNIIKTRIEKELVIGWRASSARKQGTKRRRGAFERGKKPYARLGSTNLRVETMARINAICEKLGIARSVLIRDAIDVYLGIAEQEIANDPEFKVVTRVKPGRVTPDRVLKERALLRGYLNDGLSIGDIAHLIGKSRNAVIGQIYKMRRKDRKG